MEMAGAVWWVRLDSTRNQLANSVRFPEVRAVAVGFTPPGVDLLAKRTQAAESVAQSLVFGGDGFSESLLNPVKNLLWASAIRGESLAGSVSSMAS